MKKFLVCLFVCVLVISAGFTVFFLVGNQEKITLSASTLYAKVGDEFTLGVNIANKKKGTTLSISSSDEEIVAYSDGKFKAVSSGVARINVRTSNAKYRNLYCDVLVGDGSVDSPYYINSASDLALIGSSEEFSLDKNYKLVNDIDLSEVYNGYFRPLGNLSGRFDGNGYTIKNLYLNEELYVSNNFTEENYITADFSNAGLFNSVLAGGAAYNFKLENFYASGEYLSIGTVCAYNYGVVERIEVVDARFDVQADYIGGIVAFNISSSKGTSDSIARIDRSSANITVGYSENIAVGANGVIGGIVANNRGGIIVYVYSKGKVALGNSAIYGGVVGINEFIELNSNFGGNIKDSYSIIEVDTKNLNATSIAGAFVGKNLDKKLVNIENGIVTEIFHNRIIGCFYNKDNSNGLVGVGKTFVAKENGEIEETEIEEVRFYLLGYSSYELKNPNNLFSNGNEEQVEMWDFNNVWLISKNVNEGFPIIDLTKIAVDSDFTFNKIINKLTLNVIFNYNGATGGNGTSSKIVAVGEMIGNLPIPSRQGYSFAGWYFDSNFNSKVNSTYVVNQTSDFNIYARWVQSVGKILFNYNGATSGNAETERVIALNEKYGTLPTPTKEGYTFDGWYTSSAFATKAKASDVMNSVSTITLYAKWVKNVVIPVQKYTINFKSNLPNNDYWIGEKYRNANYKFNFSSTLSSKEYASVGKVSEVDAGSVITKSLKSNSNGVAVVEFSITSQEGKVVKVTYTMFYDGYANYSFIINGREYSSSSSINEKVNSNLDVIAKYNYSGVSSKSNMGTASNPVAIKSVADWNNLVVCLSDKEVVNGNKYSFTQQNNLTINASGINQVVVLNGLYNGNGKTISFSVAGVSPFVNVCGEVKNLKVKYASGTQTFNIFGGITQCLAGGAIENCEVSGTINNANICGGIVGYVSTTSEIKNCVNNAKITINNKTTKMVGGIVGRTKNATIISCVNNSAISVVSAVTLLSVAGIVGYADSSEISNSYSNANVSAQTTATGGGAYVGGFIGFAINNISVKGTEEKPLVNKGNISALATSSACAGGIIGVSSGATQANIKFVKNNANVNSKQTDTTLTEKGTVMDNGFETFKVYSITGGIIGFSANKSTTISNVETTRGNNVSSSSVARSSAGNILGVSNESVALKISNSIYNGNVIVNKDYKSHSINAGGILGCYAGVGYIEINKVSSGINYSSINIGEKVASGIRNIGGLIGAVRTTSTSKSSQIIDCINTTSLSILNGGASIISYVGGMVGCVVAEANAPFIIKGASKTTEEIDYYNGTGKLAVGGVIGYAKNVKILSTIDGSMFNESLYRLFVHPKGIVYAGGVIGACSGVVTINNSAKTSYVRSAGDIKVGGTDVAYVGGLVGICMNNGTLNIYKNANNSTYALHTGEIEAYAKTVYSNKLVGARTTSSKVNIY